MARWLVVIAVAILATACGDDGGATAVPTDPPSTALPTATRATVTAQPEDTPPPAIGSPSSYTKPIEPTLDDRTGLAIDIVEVAPTDGFEEGLTTEPSGEPNVLVSWYTSACELEPTISLAGSTDGIAVTVFGGPVLPVECPALLVPRTVRVDLTSAVDVATATFAVREGEPPE